MSQALICPKCGSHSLRRSRRVNARDMIKMLMGVYPFRCNSCTERFWGNVWLVSIWRWAKCPRCLNIHLADWPNRPYHLSLWTQIKTNFGARKHRCTRCRINFVSFRPRCPDYADAPAETGALDADEQRTPAKPG